MIFVPSPPPLVVAKADFETYSEAGHVWDEGAQKWRALIKNKPSIKGVGGPAYTDHVTLEALCLSYDLGAFVDLWIPGMPDPEDLFEHIARGGLVSAWNANFERMVWEKYCTPVLGWPVVPVGQWRCTMAKARLHGLPGTLALAGRALDAPQQKHKDGARLIRKFCSPRKPTKKNLNLRLRVEDDPADAAGLYAYCADDVSAEKAIDRMLPAMPPEEMAIWTLDQKINTRGVQIDTKGLADCLAVLELARDDMNRELRRLTGDAVDSADAVAQLRAWVTEQGFPMDSCDADTVEWALKQPELPKQCERALQIRQALGSKSTSKLYSMSARLSTDGRLRELFAYCGADRTKRWAGRGPQPQNLPKAKLPKGVTVEIALEVLATRDLVKIREQLGCPVEAIKACLRGLFCAAEGKELIASDFSAIEAVVLAAVAGEEWRLEVFRTPGADIYLEGASRITGTPKAEYYGYPSQHEGENHPHRQAIGKVSELASGFGGGLGAWKRFGADAFMTDSEIQANIKKWRKASPMIPRLWYALRDAAVAAVKAPGIEYAAIQTDWGGNPVRTAPISYVMLGDILYCKLPSGGTLKYHQPEVVNQENRFGRREDILSYMNYNTDGQRGPIGWFRIESWYGLLVENVVQAIARDIMAAAMLRVEDAGYWIVLHVHDEIVAEIEKLFGSIEEFEALMSVREDWFADWPINVGGGYRAPRYRKG